MDPITWYMEMQQRKRQWRRELVGSIIGGVIYFALIGAALWFLR